MRASRTQNTEEREVVAPSLFPDFRFRQKIGNSTLTSSDQDRGILIDEIVISPGFSHQHGSLKRRQGESSPECPDFTRKLNCLGYDVRNRRNQIPRVDRLCQLLRASDAETFLADLGHRMSSECDDGLCVASLP